jgi:hypothetical protein
MRYPQYPAVTPDMVVVMIRSGSLGMVENAMKAPAFTKRPVLCHTYSEAPRSALIPNQLLVQPLDDALAEVFEAIDGAGGDSSSELLESTESIRALEESSDEIVSVVSSSSSLLIETMMDDSDNSEHRCRLIGRLILRRGLLSRAVGN